MFGIGLCSLLQLRLRLSVVWNWCLYYGLFLFLWSARRTLISGGNTRLNVVLVVDNCLVESCITVEPPAWIGLVLSPTTSTLSSTLNEESLSNGMLSANAISEMERRRNVRGRVRVESKRRRRYVRYLNIRERIIRELRLIKTGMLGRLGLVARA